MKKLIIIATVLFCSSCSIPQQGDTIKKITQHYASTDCEYLTQSTPEQYERDYGFYAPCGTYQIGDTVKFCK